MLPQLSLPTSSPHPSTHTLPLIPHQLTSHRCPPLTGCTITVTGLDEHERSKVKELCKSAGGTYTGELTKDICTHLLVGNKSSKRLNHSCSSGCVVSISSFPCVADAVTNVQNCESIQ